MSSWHNWTNYVKKDIDKMTTEKKETREETKEETKEEYNPFSVHQLTIENKKLKEELEFYKSLFKYRRNSCIFNLKIKKMNGENVWVDRVRDQREDFLKLDMDEEVEEWLKPIKCER